MKRRLSSADTLRKLEGVVFWEPERFKRAGVVT